MPSFYMCCKILAFWLIENSDQKLTPTDTKVACPSIFLTLWLIQYLYLIRNCRKLFWLGEVL